MRRITMIFISLFIVLVACSDEEVTPDEEKTSNTQPQDILNQAIDQANETSNVMVDYSIKQEIDLPEIEQNITVEQTDTTYIELDPFRFLTEVQTPFGQFTVFNQDGELFIYDSEKDAHEPINLDELSNFEEIIKKQRHLTEILSTLEQYSNEMQLNEENNQYILSFESDGEAFQSYVYNQLVTASIEGSNLPIKEENIQVNSVSMELVISKDNYEVAELFTGFEMNRKNDEDTTINQTIDRVYYDYDQNTKEIPKVN